jgi:glycerate kinase
VLEVARFDERLREAGLCITGEGALDAQSAYGKSTVVVARHARRAGVPAVAIVGSVGPGYERALQEGLAVAVPIATGPADLATLMREGRVLIRAAAERLARVLQLGSELATVSR